MNNKDNGGPALVVPLKGGGYALISEIDAVPILSQRWRLGQNGYVYRVGARVAGVQCLLHRIIAGATAGFDVHHINGDKTDCRRENLQVLSQSEHQDHHKHIVTARNVASRKYSETANCYECNETYTKNPDHRGRQKYCSKRCSGIARQKNSIADAMLEARK